MAFLSFCTCIINILDFKVLSYLLLHNKRPPNTVLGQEGLSSASDALQDRCQVRPKATVHVRARAQVPMHTQQSPFSGMMGMELGPSSSPSGVLPDPEPPCPCGQVQRSQSRSPGMRVRVVASWCHCHSRATLPAPPLAHWVEWSLL